MITYKIEKKHHDLILSGKKTVEIRQKDERTSKITTQIKKKGVALVSFDVVKKNVDEELKNQFLIYKVTKIKKKDLKKKNILLLKGCVSVEEIDNLFSDVKDNEYLIIYHLTKKLEKKSNKKELFYFVFAIFVTIGIFFLFLHTLDRVSINSEIENKNYEEAIEEGYLL